MGKKISPAVAVIVVLAVVVIVVAIGYFAVLRPKQAAAVGADDGVYGPEDMGEKAKMDQPAAPSSLPSGAPTPM